MNAPFLTQAADGLPRRAFTNRDILRMVEAGVFAPDESFELIKGEIVPMSPEYDRHLKARARLHRIFARGLSDDWCVISEGSLFLADDIEFKPDLHIFPASMKSEDVRGRDVRLAVELSSTTQKRDLELKAPLYARHGLKELWVIDLDARRGLIFDRIEDGRYAPGRAIGADDVFCARAFPAVSLRPSDVW